MPELTEEQKKALEEQKKQCPFCRIVSGEIPATKVFEDEKMLAILDINPATKGHTLVMPKEHYPIMAMLPPDIFKHFFTRLPELSKCIEDAMISDGIEVFIASGGAAGQNVGHFMLHLIPREGGDGLDKFTLKDKELPSEKLEEIKKIVKNNLELVMQRRMGKIPSKFTEEQVMKILDQNPSVKEMIIRDPVGFRQVIPKNPQLAALFKDVNADEIIEKISGKKMEKKEKKAVDENKAEKNKSIPFTDSSDNSSNKKTKNKSDKNKSSKSSNKKSKNISNNKPNKDDDEIDFDKISEMLG